MNARLKSAFLIESSQVIDQIGNTFVLNLSTRLREIEAVARSLALLMEQLPPVESLLHQVVPSLLNFHGDLTIAGGGVWFEPYQFHPERDRCCFFWGRCSEGPLHYFDGYNQAAVGYHHEPWYVVGHYAQPGQCLWSKSYVDPYSHERMVSCTTPFFKAGGFAGVVTVDLRLEGLQTTVNRWQQTTGGYIFVLDRNNQLITFPNLTQTKKADLNDPDRSLEGFLSIHQLAEHKLAFAPFLAAVEALDRQVLTQSDSHFSVDLDLAQALRQRSDLISAEESQLLAAILSTPSPPEERTDYLQQKFELARDGLLQETAIAFLFQVPQVYWKVFIVKPQSEINAATYNLIQADKMATLGQMLAGVAHEMNNPLNFLVANLSHAKAYVDDLLRILGLYQTTYDPPIDAIAALAAEIDLDFLMTDFPKLLRSMEIGADRTFEIIKALRIYSRLDEETYRPINLHNSLDNTLLLLGDRLRGKSGQIGIKVVKDYGDLPLVECFQTQISQVFTNLIVNAIEALEEINEQPQPGTRDRAFIPTIQIQTRVGEAQQVYVRVTDNGLGISPEVQQRLFNPFFTTKPLGKGTGLGLAICRQIVTERHGGKIVCRSALDQGTEFSVELPIKASLAFSP